MNIGRHNSEFDIELQELEFLYLVTIGRKTHKLHKIRQRLGILKISVFSKMKIWIVIEESTQTVDCICTLSPESFAILIRLVNIFCITSTDSRVTLIAPLWYVPGSNSSKFQYSIKRRSLTVCQL